MTQAARTRPAPIPDVANEDLPTAGYSPAQGAQESGRQESGRQESGRQESGRQEFAPPDLTPPGAPDDEPPHYDLIELLFFAYRDFVADPDRILAEYGFGRAHHRVLHFVDRHPGLTIAELLDILRITKQSLNRVLKELIEQGYIAQRTGTSDRRHRLLTCTPKGRQLAQRLAGVQGRRVRRALAEMGPSLREPASRFLLAMIEPEERAAVSRLIAGGEPTAEIPAGNGACP
ncbi:MarR family winged helix-turn-helix transcriptional regulator [Methylobacterium tarhaniae]|uniref:MarR family winged helix-turn-helix transcriptional regulator n=1 Tax=Methylobacterium tarhaniae TaxID=1187852 RepID=UPI000B26CFCD|nr:MarR family transcriptional regulator [Methylobacterium tarhaniae]